MTTKDRFLDALANALVTIVLGWGASIALFFVSRSEMTDNVNTYSQLEIDMMTWVPIGMLTATGIFTLFTVTVGLIGRYIIKELDEMEHIVKERKEEPPLKKWMKRHRRTITPVLLGIGTAVIIVCGSLIVKNL